MRGRLTALLGLLLVLVVGCADVGIDPNPVADPTPVPVVPAAPAEIVVGIDDLGAGFNPHLLAHSSPLATAVASLVLPSVFRPDEQGELHLDPTIATSAEVVSTDPFTVTYELNREASWSTNTPIEAGDFVYLWEQMRSQPGVADAAGYRLITDVRSRAAGKAVDVVFSEPYPAWRTLFSGLLPASLVRDAPGSWIGALTGGIPASGGPFRIATIDPGRGEVVLARNDLYWDTPTPLDQLVFRRLDGGAIASGLAVGDIDIALTEAGPTLRTALSGVAPAPQVQTAPQPTVTQLTFRADSGPLRDIRVRQALGALIDREAVRAAVAPEAVSADAFTLAPSQPGYAATSPQGVPARPDPLLAEQLLTAAGWVRDVGGNWTVDGAPAELVLGAAEQRPEDQRVAQLVAAQLGVAGIGVRVVQPPAIDLFGSATVPDTSAAGAGPSTTPTSTPTTTPATTTAGAATTEPELPPGLVAVDIAVGPRTVGMDAGTELASDYGCALPTPLVPEPAEPAGGFCFPALQSLLESTATGTIDAAGVDAVADPGDAERIAVAEQLLWEQLPMLPLFQPTSLVVSTAAADAATGISPGPLTTGPISGAAGWQAPSGD